MTSTPQTARASAGARAEPRREVAFDLDDPELYLNRELSWLDFNDRVLAEAKDPRNPLLERVKFVAITSSNLDEFYEKRIGWLQRLLRTNPARRTVDGLTVAAQLMQAKERCAAMRHATDELWMRELRPALAAAGVRIVSFDSLNTAEQAELGEHFERMILPVLTPLVVDPAHPFPFISGGSLSLVIELGDPGSNSGRFARVKVPPNRPRFIEIGDGRFVPIEEVIGAFLHLLFNGVEVRGWNMVRVLRSADIGEPGEAAQDLRELIESQLEQRRLASAVALEAPAALPAAHRRLLLDELDLDDSDVIEIDDLIGKDDLMQIGTLPRPDLSMPPFTPAVPSSFANIEDHHALFALLRERDVMVSHPYESFDATVARFVEAAAQDPQVLAIKQTLYRTSPDSPVLESLIDAAGKGKQVAVVVELSARFDEANNIEWTHRLEQAGVHIAYGSPALKVHSKTCLVVREEESELRLYAHIGTGNYNSATARVYSDLGVFTSDHGICSDLVTVFNHLTGSSAQPVTDHLVVAPTTLRRDFEQRVRREIEHARNGRPARVIFKMNALEDARFTRLLYEAAQAGVQVDLIVRGICRLRPGLEGLSERVRVVSVVGRFLEHARIYYFENDGDPEYFIGSADLMERNMDERIEILTPIRQADLREQLQGVLDDQLADPRQGWELRDSEWERDPECPRPGVHAELLARAPFS
ncbi:MAG: polyphosphate kinase 1 [Chloroflexi bacterium]|nr:polyphosphate kinase 1 [Chloroflexota bacterium]